jgi:hypothetical protein
MKGGSADLAASFSSSPLDARKFRTRAAAKLLLRRLASPFRVIGFRVMEFRVNRPRINRG